MFANFESRHAKATELGCTKGHPGPVYFVLVRVVMGRIDPLVPRASSEWLQGDLRSRAQQMEAVRGRRYPGGAIAGRAHQHVAPEPAQIGYGNGPAPAGNRIPEYQSGCGAFRLCAGPIRNVAGEIIEARSCDL